MDKIEISIVGRDPCGVINATEIAVYHRGSRIDSGDPDWKRLRKRLSLVIRQWSKEIILGIDDSAA